MNGLFLINFYIIIMINIIVRGFLLSFIIYILFNHPAKSFGNKIFNFCFTNLSFTVLNIIIINDEFYLELIWLILEVHNQTRQKRW